MVWQWGQFLDHDLSLTPETSPRESLPIAIPQEDPAFDHARTGLTMPFNRSEFDPATCTGPDNPREQINTITAHGLPDYNSARIAYGLPPARTFADVSSEPELQDALQRAYSSIDELDLWAGGLAEDHAPGAMLGETFRTILADQFRRLRDGDRYWYEGDPYFLANPGLLAELRATTLADVIRRNTPIGDEIPDRIFGGSPPAAATAEPDESADDCLSGPIAVGFSLVVYEGGSVERLEACARSLHVTALWVLDDGEFVPLFLAAPEFVKRPFRELFAHDVPPVTPLIVKSDGSPQASAPDEANAAGPVGN